MSNIKKMPPFTFIIVSWFTALFALAFFLEGSAFFLQKDRALNEETPYGLKDKKLLRTVKKVPSYHDPHYEFRNTAIDRPGVLIRLNIPQETLQKFKKARGFSRVNPVKTKWKDVQVTINNFSERPALMRVHGWSSAQVDRKSFNVDLLSFQKFRDNFRLRKFYLLNSV